MERAVCTSVSLNATIVYQVMQQKHTVPGVIKYIVIVYDKNVF